MLVCTCCGLWKVKSDPTHPKGPLLRVTHNGFMVADCKSVEEVAAVLERYGKSLADLEER